MRTGGKMSLFQRVTSCLLLLIVGSTFTGVTTAAEPVRKTENVVIVTLDGFRWQELFNGADESFMVANQGGVRDVPGLKEKYLRDSSTVARKTLMPFFWKTVAREGQVFGNPDRKSVARVTNGLNFSYPGYSELFCGVADPRINSNAKKPNPNESVLEFLNGRPGFRDRVEVVCTWGVFPSIFRTAENGLRIHTAWEPIAGESLTTRELMMNAVLERLPRYWPDNALDLVAMEATRSAIARRHPRVLYLSLGETDEWGHARRYDLYLDAAHSADVFLAELWNTLQDDPQYKGKTTLLITTDHGRGSTRADWISHGRDIPGAEYIWMAVLGPDTPALGECEQVEVTQSQVAATIAALLGEDFLIARPDAAKPLPVFRGP